MPGLCDVSSKFYTISYRFTVYLLCHKKRSLIRSKRNEQGSKQTYLILLFSAPILTPHERKSTSSVAMDFAFRQGKARREYFVYFRELQRSLSGKARHPWLWILRSGKANPDGNTLCISKGFNDAWAEKARHGSRLRMLRSPIANVEMLCRRAEVEGGRTPATPRTMSPVLKEMMKR